jgi:MFS family permease
MPSYFWYAVSLPPVGIASMTTMNAANATMQLSVAPAMRGRVMSLYLAVFFGGTPIGSPVVGWLADQYGPRWSLIGGGSVTAVAAALAALWLARRSGMSLGSALPIPRGQTQPAEPHLVGTPQVDTGAPAGFE